MSPACRLVLASRSPRRQQLLEQIGVRFEVRPVDVVEQRADNESPHQYVRRVARDKARAGLASLADAPSVWVLGSDTEVVHDDRVFGKPENDAEATAMLSCLAGSCHQVISCVWLVGTASEHEASCISQVSMAHLDEARIAAYVATGEPHGKAGAYAIQGHAAAFIKHLSGSYSAVMGLPLYETAQLLRGCGLI
ncbi:MAG: Maf family protein [Rhodanobacteraceae bacterium]